jgi:hypothetical protein
VKPPTPQHPAHPPAPALVPARLNGAHQRLSHEAQIEEIHKSATAFEALLGRVIDNFRKAQK